MNERKEISEGFIYGLLLFGIIFIIALFKSFYLQDVGEVVVIKSWTGKIYGSTSDEGFHVKAPWTKKIKYDVRNNVITFYGKNTKYHYDDGTATGPRVTVNDKSGATANMDIQINYSLDPKVAVTLYADYGTQETFTKNVAAIDCRSIPREVCGQFTTIQMLTSRGDIANAIQEALVKKWEKYGLIVEDVSVQEIKYSKAITQSYADAQAAEIAKQKALNKQETAKVNAETKKIEAEVNAETKRINAEAEANANSIINNSLTENVIRQNYIDALREIGKNGNLVVVPEGSTPMVQVGE